MRRLHPRGAASRGIVVDSEGVTLGPDCVLVRRTAAGYRCLSRNEAAALQRALFSQDDPDWLFRQCRRIARTLDGGKIALAQIYGLHIPIGDLDERQLIRLAAAVTWIKANFNPDEPRVPAGNPDGGQWTSEGGSPAEGSDGPVRPIGEHGARSGTVWSDYRDDGGGRSDAEDIDPDLLPAAYQGYYQDAVVKAFREYLIARGGRVVTSVPLAAIDGTTAVADMIVKLPGETAFVLEVKTGKDPQFTPSQQKIYPMVQIGSHVTSSKASIGTVGLTPGKPLPPLAVWIYWSPGPGQPAKLIELPPPSLYPDDRAISSSSRELQIDSKTNRFTGLRDQDEYAASRSSARRHSR
jgi:hypothetical protein